MVGNVLPDDLFTLRTRVALQCQEKLQSRSIDLPDTAYIDDKNRVFPLENLLE